MKKLILILLIFTACNDSRIVEPVIEITSIDGLSSVAGKGINCILNVDEFDFESNLTFTVTGGSGLVEINNSEYKQGDIIKYPDNKKSFPFRYIPTTTGEHILNISLNNPDISSNSSIQFTILEPKLETEVIDLEPSVSLGKITSFKLLVNTDMDYVECIGEIIKGSGKLYIEENDLTKRAVVLNKNNTILFKPESSGENRIELTITSKAKSTNHIIVINTIKEF